MATGGKYGQADLQAYSFLLTDTSKAMLTTSAHVPSQDADVYRSDLDNEVVGTGYTAGGATLTGKTLTYTAGTNVVMFDADDVTWPNSTITARHVHTYRDTGVVTTSLLLTCSIQTADVGSVNGTLSLPWPSSGVFTNTATAW